MGNIFFSMKKKNAKERLEAIQDEMNRIDSYKLKSFIRQKNYIAFIYFLFILIYPMGLIYIYFIFDKNDRLLILYSLIFIISLPVFVYLMRKYLHIYFKWIAENNNVRLVELIKEKKQILSKVQETETFNDAKSILEKYDPSILKNLSLSLTNLSQIDTMTPNRERRTSTFSHQEQQQQQQQSKNLQNNLQSPRNRYHSLSSQANNRNFMPQMSNLNTTPMIGYGKRTVKPILPQNRSAVEKIIDYMFNDGPDNRYALICTNCSSHNGMALPDEFNYIAYICAYCGTFNPSRKIRPTPPKVLQTIEAPPSASLLSSSTTTTEQKLNQSDSNLKIFELSTELNKTKDSTIQTPHIEEPDDENDSDHNKKQTESSNNNDDNNKKENISILTDTHKEKIDDKEERIRSIDSSSDDE